MGMLLFALMLACAPSDDSPVIREGRPGGADDTGVSGGEEEGGGDDTGDWEPGETGDEDRVTCSATTSRGRCSLTNPTELMSPTFEPGLDFDAIVPSWNAVTPEGSWIEVELRARVDGDWTPWLHLGVWAAGDSEVERHSVNGQSGDWGRVYTDTVVLNGYAQAVRLKVTTFPGEGGEPTVSRLAVAVADTDAEDADEGGLAWGSALSVPERSQMEFEAGQAWCSPTSTSMQLGAAAERLGDSSIDADVPTAADQVWDEVYGGTGNWPFNTAFAATRGLESEVGWMGAVSQLEPWIDAGWPVAISAAWGPGELDGAPISSSSGHLLLVRGFTADGDVLVHDPAAATDAGVPRTYDREQFRAAWMGGSGGIAYLVWDGERPDG